MDNREWVKENTADMREEVQASTNELEEIDKIMGPALDKNKKLPKSAVCNQPNAVYLFNIALDTKTWVWQYPVLAKVKQKVAESENKEFGVLSKERERERITKDFGNPEKA